MGCEAKPEEIKREVSYVYETYTLGGEKVKQELNNVPEKVLVIGEKNAERLMYFGLEEQIASLAYLETVDNDKIKNISVLSKEWPLKESVLQLKPDLIYGVSTVFQKDRLGDFSFWNKQGIAIGTTSNYEIGVSPNQFYDEIREMGDIFQITEKTDSFINMQKEHIDKTIESSKGHLSNDSVLFIASDGRGNYYYYPDNYHLVDDVLRDLEGNYMDLGDQLITLSHESLLDLNPDRIIFTSFMDGETVNSTDGWLTHKAIKNVKAIKNKRILEVYYDDVIRGNENLSQVYQTVSEFLEEIQHE